MKLLDKYNWVHILSTLVILILSGFAYYFIIKAVLLRQIDKDLHVEEEEILDYVALNKHLPPAANYKHQQTEFEKLAASQGHPKREIINTSKAGLNGEGQIPYRRLSFPVEINGSYFKAIVYKSEVGSRYLLNIIVGITCSILLLLFIVIFFLNRFVLGQLWQPFFNTLKQLKSFNLSSRKALELPKCSIDEFHELNQSVTQMTQRVSKEFESLKHFTENASHEIQTPLAIIRSKLDLLIQTSREDQAEALQSIYNSTERLTKLNQTLLLLTKIGNNQYQVKKSLNLKELVVAKFIQFEELIKSRNIQLSLDLEDFQVMLNQDLVDILLNNLISNAIRHNYDGGIIHCQLHKNKLKLSNTGTGISVDVDHIFERFSKGNDSKGVGLGLAVVKEICDAFQIEIDYTFDGLHHVRLNFPLSKYFY